MGINKGVEMNGWVHGTDVEGLLACHAQAHEHANQGQLL